MIDAHAALPTLCEAPLRAFVSLCLFELSLLA